ncbi:putative glutaminase [Pyronema domesticum]|nr:putative glutaminase [Pyronema domesticum]
MQITKSGPFLFVTSVLLWTTTSAASSIHPPVLPLAVRNPYLSVWYNSRQEPWKNWPMFWTGEQLGFGIMARLPSKRAVYPLVGRAQDSLTANSAYALTDPIFQGFQYDSHSTTLSYNLGNAAKIELYFSSPITGDSIMRQSLPASYVEVKVTGNEDVELYVEIDGASWVSHDRNVPIKWGFSRTSTLQSWAVSRQTELLFTERSDRAEWGTFFFTAPADPSVTSSTSDAGAARASFATTGIVSKNSTQPVALGNRVFAFSKPFSKNDVVSNTTVLFTLAMAQDPIVQFAGKDGYLPRRPLWTQYYKSASEMLSFHYNDYQKALTSASVFTNKVSSEATRLVSSAYADILALSARQVMGATYFTGTPKDPIINLKEISSNGNYQTVDVIFPAFPFFLYLNPSWLAYLLEPLLEHQNAGLYPNAYSIHDLGAHFPNATGHPDGNDEPMPVEECGNMLIMALAYARTLDAKSAAEWINRDGRYKLWKQWSSFLVRFSLLPDKQLSTDDFAGRLENQTNLALKGIIGIRAMAELSNYIEETEDAKNYTSIALDYIPKWQEMAMSRDGTHTKLAYHWEGSWGSLYNSYADALLCFHLDAKPFLAHEVYQKQSKWYSLVHQRYGLPLDSRHLYTKSDWEIWTAAVADDETRRMIIDSMGKWLEETSSDRPFTDLYESHSGGFADGITFMARPVAGGHFAVVALEGFCNNKAGQGVRAMMGEASL